MSSEKGYLFLFDFWIFMAVLLLFLSRKNAAAPKIRCKILLDIHLNGDSLAATGWPEDFLKAGGVPGCPTAAYEDLVF